MKLSKVNSKYGAPMGRAGLPTDLFATRADGESKIHLVYVRLQDGGYDSGGAYWGMGWPLFHAYFYYPDGTFEECFLRAPSRELAKKQLLEHESGLKFFR